MAPTLVGDWGWGDSCRCAMRSQVNIFDFVILVNIAILHFTTNRLAVAIAAKMKHFASIDRKFCAAV
jgi:hypothetical protein